MEYAPYADFSEYFNNSRPTFDEKLVRTYFHQLIDGLSYLHSLKVYHLDLKLENLLIGEDFQLKITDFDASFRLGINFKVICHGSLGFRAPEIRKGSYRTLDKSDIYSAGIILFALMFRGKLPHDEDDSLEDYLINDVAIFWEFHEKKIKRKEIDPEFKNLFEMMTYEDPERRATIDKIKASKWFNREIYSKTEVKSLMKRNFNIS